MIVEDQLDRRASWIGGVEQLEEFDEFAGFTSRSTRSMKGAPLATARAADDGLI